MQSGNRGGRPLGKIRYFQKGWIHRGLSVLLSLSMAASLFSGMTVFPAYAQEAEMSTALTESEGMVPGGIVDETWEVAREATEEETREETKARLLRQIKEEGWNPYGGTMTMDEFYALMELFQDGALPLEEEGQQEEPPVADPDDEGPDIAEPDTEGMDSEDPDAKETDAEAPDPQRPDAGETDPETPDIEIPDTDDPDIEGPNIEDADPGDSETEDPDAEDPEDPEIQQPEAEVPALEQPSDVPTKSALTGAAEDAPGPEPVPEPDPASDPAPELGTDPEPEPAPEPTSVAPIPDDPASNAAGPGVMPLDDPLPGGDNPEADDPNLEDPDPDDPEPEPFSIPRTMFLFDGVKTDSTPGTDSAGNPFGPPQEYDNITNYEPVENGSGFYYPSGLGDANSEYTRPPLEWKGVVVDDSKMEALVIVKGENEDDPNIAGNVDQSLFLKYNGVYIRRVSAQDNDVNILGAVKPRDSEEYVYYYTSRDQQSTEVSATILPEGQKFIIHYAHNEYPISYTVRINDRVGELQSIYGGDIVRWVQDMPNVTDTWADVIFDKDFPTHTDLGAYSFNATAPDGYTLSFFLAKTRDDEGNWSGATPQLVGTGGDFDGPGEYHYVNNGWALGEEPRYTEYDKESHKWMPDTTKGPAELLTTATFYNNDVDGERIVAVVLKKKEEPKFSFDHHSSDVYVGGRGATALTEVEVTNRQTGKKEKIPYDYEDDYLSRNNSDSKYIYPKSAGGGNVLPKNASWNWDKVDSVMTRESPDHYSYSFSWTFQTNSGDSFLLDVLEINRVGITIPYFAKYKEDPNSGDEEYPAPHGDSGDLWSWRAVTELPDGALVEVEYLMVFKSSAPGKDQRVYRINVTGAKNDVTITAMNLNMYAGGAPEISFYDIDGVTGATGRSNYRTTAVQCYQVNGIGWNEDNDEHGNQKKGTIIISTNGGGIDYSGGDWTNKIGDYPDGFLDPGSRNADKGFGGANIRFKLAEGYSNPYYLFESARYGTIRGADGKTFQASVERTDSSEVNRGAQNPVIPFISDGTDPYMRYDEGGVPYPVDKDGEKLYYYENGVFRQFTYMELDNLRIRTVNGNDLLAPELYRSTNGSTPTGGALAVNDVIAKEGDFTFRWEDEKGNKDAEKPLDSRYIYSGLNGWHYIRLTSQQSYKIGLITVRAFPSRYVVRYKPGGLFENGNPVTDEATGQEVFTLDNPPDSMPSYSHSDSCPTFLQGDPGDDREERQFDDNIGLFYDIVTHTDIGVSSTKPADPGGNYRFLKWVLVDENDIPVEQHVLGPDGNWLYDENHQPITRKVFFASGSFDVNTYSEFAILNGDLGTTANDIYVLRLMPVWERVENPFHYAVALNWVDAAGGLHTEYFSSYWQDILTDFKQGEDGETLTVKVLTDAVPFQNWIAQHPTYTFWDNVNNAPDDGTIEEELKRYLGEHQENYDTIRSAMIKRGDDTKKDANNKPVPVPQFDRMGNYTYAVLKDEGTIVLWMLEDKGGLVFRKSVDPEPFVYGDEFYFTVSRVTAGEDDRPLDGVYKAYPDKAYDEISGEEREVQDRDAWLVRFQKGSITHIVKNDGTYGDNYWPSDAVTWFTLRDGESIRLFVPEARYTITELGSKSGGSYMVDVIYIDSDGKARPRGENWEFPPLGARLRGSEKTITGGSNASQVSVTVDFAVGENDIVNIVNFSNQTCTLSFEPTVIGPYQNEAFGYRATLILPRGTSPLYDAEGKYYYYNFNLYDVTYPQGQEPANKSDVAGEQPTLPERPVEPARPDLEDEAAYQRWLAEYQAWQEKYAAWLEAYQTWLDWITWEPPGELAYSRSGRIVVKNDNPDKIEPPTGSTVWVSDYLLIPVTLPNGEISGWTRLTADGGVWLREGQRIYVVCTVPDGGADINYYLEETNRQGYRVMGGQLRTGKAASAELVYQLFINSKLEGLPATGGPGVRGLFLSGLVLLLSSLGLALLDPDPRKKRRQAAKRLIALALIPVMALTMAVPAMAASYQVRIHPNDYTSVPTGSGDSSRAGRFSAYQIFVGELENYSGGDGVNRRPVVNNLTISGWGSSISPGNYEALLCDLIRIDTPAREMGVTEDLLLRTRERYFSVLDNAYEAQYKNGSLWRGGQYTPGIDSDDLLPVGRQMLTRILTEALADDNLTLGSLFRAALEDGEAYTVTGSGNDLSVSSASDPTLGGSARVVAAVLNDFTEPSSNTVLGEAFANLVSKYLTAAPYATSSWNESGGYWTIGSDSASADGALQSGYYLFVDNHEYDGTDSDRGTAQSDHILAVLGSQDIYVKSHAPTLNKIIANPDNGNQYGDDFEFGDTVVFRLTGTLPENFDNYQSYPYSFTDTMADGLTYLDGTMKVYAVAPGGGIYLIAEDAAEDGDDPSSDSNDPALQNPSSTATMIVDFSDLKEVRSGRRVSAFGGVPGAEQDIAIADDWQIVVQYQAVMGQGAGGGNTFANPKTSSAFLTYSSSVILNSRTSETNLSTDYLYDFGIDILKYDGTKGTDAPLPDAGFALTRKNGGDLLYAVFEQADGSAEDYALRGWISAGELAKYLGAGSAAAIDWDAVKKERGGILGAAADGSGTKDLTGSCVCLVTGDNGRLRIRGLKDETYTLSEVSVPKPAENWDFEKLGDITIEFAAQYYSPEPAENTPGRLKELYCVIDGARIDMVTDGVLAADDFSSLSANLELPNITTGFFNRLPRTGGAGVILFYIAGSALVVGAALLLILSQHKEKSE